MITVRKANKEDIETLRKLYQQGVDNHQPKGELDYPKEITTEFVKEVLDAALVYLIQQDNEPVGTFRISDTPIDCDWPDNEKSYYISKLFVDRENTGKGFLQANKEYLLNLNKENRKLRLECLADNEKICAVYENLGFKCVHKKDLYSQHKNKMIQFNFYEIHP